MGNAYIGAATLDVFLKRFQGNKGVTYYKWKYQATTWEQYNGTTGKWSSEPDSDITDEGEPAPANDTVLMDWLLADEAWDFIVMQTGLINPLMRTNPLLGKRRRWTNNKEHSTRIDRLV